MRATIKEKREVAKGTLLVIFDLLGEEFDHRPGQYFWVELLDPPYLDELQEMERANPNIRLILTMTDDESWTGERRRIDAAFFEDYLGESLHDAAYMVAGPPGMAKAATAELQRAGVDEQLISTDSFS